MNAAKSQRLSRSSWLTAGARALADQGPMALKAEPLARRLGTTKGSFYWHFRDVAEFHDALLTDWLDRYAQEIGSACIATDPPAVQLRALAEHLAHPGDTPESARALEPAIRAWGGSSTDAARAIARADALKHTHLQRILDHIGVSNPEIALLLLAAAIGMRQVTDSDQDTRARAMGSLVDLVLALG